MTVWIIWHINILGIRKLHEICESQSLALSVAIKLMEEYAENSPLPREWVKEAEVAAWDERHSLARIEIDTRSLLTKI